MIKTNTKGIILAGGKGTRLFPITEAISKQLLPIYDKPMIYYPLSTLMLAGIREILIITDRKFQNNFQQLLGDGSNFGLKIEYCIQEKPNGIAQAFLLGEEFIGDENVILILGDNLFYGSSLPDLLRNSVKNLNGAKVFGYRVNNPSQFGVLDIDNNKVIGIEEKPSYPKSNFAITGLYFYDNSVIEKAKSLTPSKRGELEITDLNLIYLKEKKLEVELMGRGMAWLDTGTCDSLHQASSFIRTLEKTQGLKVSSPEEIAWRYGWISNENLKSISKKYKNSGYGDYLIKLLEEKL